MRTRWISIFAALVLAPSIGAAQPPARDHRDDNKPDRQARRLPPPKDGPTEAPPPPKAESAPAAKPGYVWVGGRWEWRADKYEWVAGHWERARKGKNWREGKWEKRGDRWAYENGQWVDGTEPAPPTPTPTPPPVGNDRPRQPPPAPQAENVQPRAGYVWVAGEWDWRGGKYEWVAGHWERERSGKKWRASKWEERDGGWTRTPGDWQDDGGSLPVVGGNDGPHEAPPPMRNEPHDPQRAGYVWVAGEWDWKNGKYEWVAGHWERERSGKDWRAGRWEQRDGRWQRTPGDWFDRDGNASQPPPPVPNDRTPRPPRRDWKMERPVVSNYWPSKGKAGSKITIRGRNFPKDAIVVWGGKEIRGVKVSEEQLVFIAPSDAVTGLIAVRAGRGRDLAVGTFEVAASFDAEAERRRLEDEARKKAEATWAERQKQMAKDRASREAAVKRRWEDRVANREQRRADRLAEIQARYARAFLADAETQDEMTLHAQRIAELERMTDVAEIKADQKLSVRIDVLRAREDERHDQRMAALDAAFRAGGAQ